MKNLLAIRLSSMGDVALTVPVLQVLVRRYPHVRITLLTRAPFVPLFQTIPNIRVIIPDLKGRHKGVLGIYRLYLDLKKQQRFDGIIDFHDVLRSQMLRFYFSRMGLPVFKINKGRKDKKRFTAKNHSAIQPLKHSTERYAKVLEEAGLKVDLKDFKPISITPSESVLSFLKKVKTQNKIIGIAPFAQYDQKKYPIEKIKVVLKNLANKDVSILIFGGGKKEKAIAEDLTSIAPQQIHSVIGAFTLTEELAIIQQVEVMLTMDSSNLHLAQLVGTKVISIWGATHPYLGFSPFLQEDETLNIQIPVAELPCRPCSVYGNQPCHRGDLACMNLIKAQTVVDKITSEIMT
ncbi:MAG: glycosyltransferase family 9 protein [Saprospiraceae bacterium]